MMGKTCFACGRYRWLVLLIICASLSACQLLLQKTQTVADPSSPLLKILMQESDFSAEWHWIRDSVYQENLMPTEENKHLVERANRTLTGEYGPEKYYIKIIHYLERYEQEPDSSIVINPEDWGFTEAETFSLAFASVGGITTAMCLRDPRADRNNTLICEVLVRYGKTVSTLVFLGVSDMDDQTIEMIINQVLTNVDNRIKERNE